MSYSPLFILASPRSFTSLISAMLGQHPQAYAVPELNLFAQEKLEDLINTMKGLYRFKLHGLLRTVAQLYTGEQSLITIEMANRWVLKHADRSTGEIYHQLCAKVAPRIIIDKSPLYGTRIECLNRIIQNFPNAYFLHLVRHPRTQGNSIMNIDDGKMAILSKSIDYSTNPPTIDPQYLWLRMQRNILGFFRVCTESTTNVFARGRYLG